MLCRGPYDCLCRDGEITQIKLYWLVCALASRPKASKCIHGHSSKDYWARYHLPIRQERMTLSSRQRGARGRSVWHGLLVSMSWTACLSRFALIKDKSSLMGCRCATLMSINPPTHTHTLIHICHSMLCSISTLALSSLHSRFKYFPVLIQLPWLIEPTKVSKKSSKLHPTAPPQAFQAG